MCLHAQGRDALPQPTSWQLAYRPSEAQLEQLSRAVEAGEATAAAAASGSGNLGAPSLAPPSLPQHFGHQV